MKKRNYPIALLAFALTLVFVLSCEEDVKLETRNEFTSIKNDPNLASGQANNVIDSKVGDPIDLATAKKWAANYRGTLKNTGDRRAHYFGSEIIQQILSQSNCVGIRIYYGIDDLGNKQLMLIGVDSNGNDLLPMAGARTNDEGNVIADASFPCPNTCPDNGL